MHMHTPQSTPHVIPPAATPKRVYQSGTFSTQRDRAAHLQLLSMLRTAGHTVAWAPELCSARELDAAGIDGVHGLIFGRVRKALDDAEVMVVLLDCIRFDDGTPWEMGYAAARGIPVYALTTDTVRVECDMVLSLGNILQGSTITATSHTMPDLLALLHD
ncbi:MAG TPA: nucleoside 2-deoxyribosyltransferase [Desulfovibrio sp.]|jgi:nucleoside 2-deoxyribosyltransferase|uniref:Nucleoside 2-deoxyribosyltransferase n=3 Tax=Nitratidesulfovibrio vulgaris TaxID=881 RepID=Q72A66_NITV2|nr:hypothetical protein DVU_2131 [Nitratidesulfovibrio vulgaris str. Hildenborough]ABM28120.1 conserved hypothetical protein [Nitratidesulfovibrio vulgaris DP4]HBW16719.1 nucleoside 2-deoxyribosyltransferase [Desulfovibrio sp.]